MEPLSVGQSVTYVDPSGTSHAATVVEAYGAGALVNVPDLSANIAAKRLQFEDALQPPPYITDAGGGQTEQSFEAPVAEE